MNTNHSIPPVGERPAPVRRAFVFLTALALVFASPKGFAHDLAAAPPSQPAQGLAQGEGTPIDITGELTVLHGDDFEHGRGQYFYSVQDQATGQQFDLHFPGTPPGHLKSGATVTVHGSGKGRDVYLAADSTGVQQVAPGAVVVAGDQSTLVMVANFKDVAVSCPLSAVQDLMFTDPTYKAVDDLYRETSFNGVSFSGQAVGPYTISAYSTDSCNPSAWADAADAAATAKGINVSAYARKVYVLPSTNSCGYSGLGQVGGTPSRAWTFRCDVADSYAHELGHNLGMNHSSTPTSEYGDTSDIMGYGGYGLRQVNAAHKEQMGWLPSQQVVAVTQANTYDIAPLEIDPTQAQAPQTLKIAKPDTGEFYYLSYRLPTGFDSNLASGYVRHLTVHRYAGTGGRTYFLQVLSDGGSYSDTVNGISFTQVSHTDSRVTVQVQLGSSCQSGAPSVAITPSSQTGNAGSTLAYTASVTNTDWAGCAASTFNLANAVPVGWSGSVSPSKLTLSPGQSGSATFSVTSATGATSGTYGLSVTTSDSSNAKHTNSATATYSVSSLCSRGTPSLTVAPSSQSSQAGKTLSYAVSVTDKDSSACTASSLNLAQSLPSGWSGSVSPTTVTLSPGQTASATLTVTSPSSAPANSYPVGVATSDSATASHSTSAGGTYLVTSDSQAPSAPTGLTVSLQRKQAGLAWNPSTDNVGVAGYRVWRNGVLIASTTSTGYTDASLSSGSYTYYVTAFDAAGNVSAASNSVTITVQSNGKR